VLDRHYTALAELDPDPELLVITADWTDTPAPTPPKWPRRSEVAPLAQHWQTLIEDPDDDPDFRIYTQLYAETRPWRPRIIDAILRAVADDEIYSVILCPPDLRWLYHPYDGGADVILPTRADAMLSRTDTEPGCPHTHQVSKGRMNHGQPMPSLLDHRSSSAVRPDTK